MLRCLLEGKQDCVLILHGIRNRKSQSYLHYSMGILERSLHVVFVVDFAIDRRIFRQRSGVLWRVIALVSLAWHILPHGEVRIRI